MIYLANLTSNYRCPLPKSKSVNNTGTVDFFYTLNGIDYLQAFGGFSYYKQPSVVAVSPKLLPKSGATVQVQISDLDGDILNLNASCKIGATIAVGYMPRGSNTIYCHFQDLDVDMAQTTQGIQISLNGYHFTDVNDNATVSLYYFSTLNPRTGSYRGDTTVNC